MNFHKAQETPETDKNDDENKPEPPHNKGTLIVDATCAPSHIKYPQDTNLLNEARESTERIISELHNPADGKKPRIHPQRAHKDYLHFARKKKKSGKEIHISVGKQLRYLRRNLGIIDVMIENGKELSIKQEKRNEFQGVAK
jgi:IS5 family transposase